MNNKNAAKSGADKKGKEIPVYTQQDDSELLEATGTNLPHADPAQTSNQTGSEGKANSHLPNVRQKRGR